MTDNDYGEKKTVARLPTENQVHFSVFFGVN